MAHLQSRGVYDAKRDEPYLSIRVKDWHRKFSNGRNVFGNAACGDESDNAQIAAMWYITGDVVAFLKTLTDGYQSATSTAGSVAWPQRFQPPRSTPVGLVATFDFVGRITRVLVRGITEPSAVLRWPVSSASAVKRCISTHQSIPRAALADEGRSSPPALLPYRRPTTLMELRLNLPDSGGGAGAGAGRQCSSVHQPDVDLSAVAVAPQDAGPPAPVVVTNPINQPVRGDRRNGPVAGKVGRGPVHQPDVDLSAVRVAPQNVTLAVAVEVAYPLNDPVRPH